MVKAAKQIIMNSLLLGDEAQEFFNKVNNTSRNELTSLIKSFISPCGFKIEGLFYDKNEKVYFVFAELLTTF